MVLKYMVSDTDLVGSQPAKQAAKPVDQSTQAAPPAAPPAAPTQASPVRKPKPSPVRKKRSAPVSKVKLLILVLANLALFAYAYNRWAPEHFWHPGRSLFGSGENASALEFLSSGKLKITGIMHYDENPAAIISGRVVYEGDVVEGCKVVKIQEDNVEFEKDGSRFTKKIAQ